MSFRSLSGWTVRDCNAMRWPLVSRTASKSCAACGHRLGRPFRGASASDQGGALRLRFALRLWLPSALSLSGVFSSHSAVFLCCRRPFLDSPILWEWRKRRRCVDVMICRQSASVHNGWKSQLISFQNGRVCHLMCLALRLANIERSGPRSRRAKTIQFILQCGSGRAQ